MTIDIENEKLITLAELSKLLPKVNGKRVNNSTLWRWCRKGRHGITLDYMRMGAKIVTTQEAAQRFFSALAEYDSEQPRVVTPKPKKKSRSAAARERELENARAILVRAKILQEAPQP